MQAGPPSGIALPGCRLHPLKGDLKGCWSLSVSGHPRLIFHFEDCDALESTLSTTASRKQHMAMRIPPHHGRSLRENCLYPLDLNVTEAAPILGFARHTLSRVLNGHVAVSPEMAIRLETAGWSSAEFWLRRQTTYALAPARRNGGRRGNIPVRGTGKVADDATCVASVQAFDKPSARVGTKARGRPSGKSAASSSRVRESVSRLSTIPSTSAISSLMRRRSVARASSPDPLVNGQPRGTSPLFVNPDDPTS